MEASLLFVHIFAAASALAAGFLALYAEKGKWIHRRFGLVFAYAMMIMTVTAAIMALGYRPNRVNVVAATTLTRLGRYPSAMIAAVTVMTIIA